MFREVNTSQKIIHCYTISQTVLRHAYHLQNNSFKRDFVLPCQKDVVFFNLVHDLLFFPISTIESRKQGMAKVATKMLTSQCWPLSTPFKISIIIRLFTAATAYKVWRARLFSRWTGCMECTPRGQTCQP